MEVIILEVDQMRADHSADSASVPKQRLNMYEVFGARYKVMAIPHGHLRQVVKKHEGQATTSVR